MIDMTTSSNSQFWFSDFKQPSEGYYTKLGTLDAQHQLPPKILPTEFAQYQSFYDSGYADGAKESPYLNSETM